MVPVSRSVEDSGAVDPAHWSKYYAAAAGAAPRAPLVAALARFDAEPAPARARLAIDLGSGGGTDTVELLRRGWRVIAIDATPQAMQVLVERPDLLGRERLETVVGLLESTTWPTADLVNTSLVLPFLPPNAVAATWERIVGSLAAGGRFAGHFFGYRVSGVNLPVRSRHSSAEVLRLLQSLDLEVFEEIEWDGRTAQGHAAHWHVFEVVARKRA
jgi:SAM-dependent methyltransferase